MSETTPLPPSPLQRQIVQMAQDLAVQLERQARQVPPSSLLDTCEALLLDRGRQFLRDALAATLQEYVAEAEKKGARPGPVRVATPAGVRAPGNANSSPPSAPSA